MEHLKWLTVGASSLIAGMIVSLAAPTVRPWAIVAASTVGAASGALITPRLSARQDSAALATELAHPHALKGDATTALLQANHQALRAIQQQLQRRGRSFGGETAGETLVLYDLENLLKGYKISDAMLRELSLTKILAELRQRAQLGPIIAQRAYANWSNPKLNTLRLEISALGIEPIQVLGFAKHHTKNAADIQLVIDAIDLAYVRPSIAVVVIISGDGGFSALAKKLHEYGITVIGCAYQGAASKTFRAVCDEFVLINDPDKMNAPDKGRILDAIAADELMSQPLPHPNKEQKEQKAHLDPRNERLLAAVGSSSSPSGPAALTKTHEVLNWYAQTQKPPMLLGLSTLKQGLKAVMPQLRLLDFGFIKFVEYMEYACTDTPFCVVRMSTSDVVIAQRDAVPEQGEILTPIAPRPVHDPHTYAEALLADKYRLPAPAALEQIAQALVQKPLGQMDVSTIIAKLNAILGEQVPVEAVRSGLLCFVAAGVFNQHPTGAPLSEQQLLLRGELRQVDDLIQKLREALEDRLAHRLSTVESDTLAQLLPLPSPKTDLTSA